MLWPPKPASLFELVAPPVPSHPGADWHEEIEARNLARRQESERVAAYYENQTART
jgi:hypothetical protein